MTLRMVAAAQIQAARSWPRVREAKWADHRGCYCATKRAQDSDAKRSDGTLPGLSTLMFPKPNKP